MATNQIFLDWKRCGKKKYCLMNVQDFSLEQIYASGQPFRWKRIEKNHFLIQSAGFWTVAIQKEGALYLCETTLKECRSVWENYFDLARDYGMLKANFAKADEHLEKATRFGDGIRILRQDIFETIITFIISSNNHIPRIKGSVAKLCEFAGEKLGEYDGEILYAFPSAEQMLAMSQEQWSAIKLGYREKYLKETARMIAEREIAFEEIAKLDTQEGQKKLRLLSGVGEKVADCILLFSMGKYDAFPVDTWMEKVMKKQYGLSQNSKATQIRFAGVERFGAFAGIAQQYLFFYERENSKRRD